METRILKPNRKSIILAAKEIKSGQAVAFATETVYGLGANALNQEAVNKIFEIKGRPSDNPLIVHVASIKDIEKIAYVPQNARRAIKKFMPGALTIILNKKEGLAHAVTCGLNTVAVRIPKNSTAIRLLKACGAPIAAPSANSSTKPSPTCSGHVYDDLNGKINYILDGGECKIGVESTILDFSQENVRLLRMGGIPLEKLSKVVGKIEIPSILNEDKPIAPGTKYLHYSPRAKVVLFNYGDSDGLERIRKLYEGKRTIILSLSGVVKPPTFKNTRQYARRLFYEFRLADKLNADVIICERSPQKGIGGAINNRLDKASSD